MNLQELKNHINAQKILTWRRHMHQYPEISFQEEETGNYIARQIEKYPEVIIQRRIKNGIVAVLDSGKSGKTVAMRADFDALPLREESDCAFKSVNDGVFHACGHDCHAAMLLGAMDVLYKIKQQLTGKIVFIFQHAEELLPGGAKDIIESGVFYGLGIEAFFAVHVFPNIPTGTVQFSPKNATANTDAFKIEIQGRGGHGSRPDKCIDPLLVGTEVLQAFNFIVSRNVAAADKAVVTVGKFNAGTAPNIIPDTAVMEGTVRTVEPDVRDVVEQRIKEITTNICAAYGAECKIRYDRGYTAVVNDKELCGKFKEIAADAVPGIKIEDMEPLMGGEDFSAYREIAPTLFVTVGAMPDSGEYYENHHPKFTVNEDALPIGTMLYTAFAVGI
jgi:amidohydrolase